MSGEEKGKDTPSLIESESKNKISTEINVPEVQEKKTFVNLYFCRMSVGIMLTYGFVFCSITTNIINRVIFLQYEFEFEFLFMLLEETSHMIFYITAAKKSRIFQNLLGEISFKDFMKLKYQYLGFTLLFIFHSLISLYGYQLVKNIPMYVNFRKFVTVMTFTYQYFFKKKKINKIHIVVVFFLTSGAILAAIDDLDTDILGYLVIFCKNILSVINLEITENFKKKNGVSNIKLLTYRSILDPPTILIMLFLSGEYKEIIKYFKANHDFSYVGLFFFIFVNLSLMLFNNLSFFLSNEKNNSLFTQLISESKYIFITVLSYFILKTFIFTWKNILGLFLSTVGAVIIIVSSMYENIELKRNKIKKDKKRFVELSNIDEMNFDNEDKMTNTNDQNNENKNDNNENNESKDETIDTDSNTNSQKSNHIEINENKDSVNISNDNNISSDIISNDDNITNTNNNSNDNIEDNNVIKDKSKDEIIIDEKENNDNKNSIDNESKNDSNGKSNSNEISNDNNQSAKN